MERQRIREDVARALEGRADRGPDREGDGCGPRDPADRRPAREVRLNEAEVGEDPGQDAEHKAYDQRPEEARLVRPRLRHRRRPREHQQRREDTEPDEVAEGEVDHPRQPVDERVPRCKEPVDPAGREAGHEHLQRDRHQ